MCHRLLLLIYCLFTIPALAQEEPPHEDLFLSTPDQVATLNNEPTYLIGGLISPLSGQPSLCQTDLIVKGAQNLVLSRTYLPLHMPCSFPKHKHNQGEQDKKFLYYYLLAHYKGWQFYPHLRLQFNPKTMIVRVADTKGVTLDFRLSGPNNSITTFASPIYAINNISRDIPSGKYDHRNTRVSLAENANKIIVNAPDGTIRFYSRQGLATVTDYLYILQKEILPNGKTLKYHYNKSHLELIESLDPNERHIYAFIRLGGIPWSGNCHFTSSSGLTVDYNYTKRPAHWKFEEKVKGVKHKESQSSVYPPLLTSVSSPFYRHESLEYCPKFLLGVYLGKNDIFTTYHTGFGNESIHYRTHKLSLPVGPGDAFIPIYELNYNPPVAGKKEGTTTVKNTDGTSIVYHFSKNLLTTLIQYLGTDGGLKKEKVFSWDDQNWLKALEMRDSQKNILYRKTYEYDGFGNPILEIFIGDLTGEGNQESYTIRRTFSQEGRHLLLSEENENGKVICFSYLPNTNLPTVKLIKDGDKILLREFFEYDDCYNLIRKINDDGTNSEKENLSGINQRTITSYILRQEAPFLHMPVWIEEKYWENDTEKLLKKSHLIYDQHGNIAQEEVYDADGQLAYTIFKTYNERGDVLSEINRLGQDASYTYDSRGRRHTSLNFSHKLHTTHHYDTKGRLKVEVATGNDGIIHTASAEYDVYDRKIQRQDIFQNVTHYTYDPLISKTVKIDLPFVASIEGKAIPVNTSSTYDAFGHELTKTDANGFTTTYHYNAYGSPIEIIHPDGGKETFRYTKNGIIERYTDPDGLTIVYTHDALNRVLVKNYISANKENLAEETFSYNGYNLLTETDKEGNVKRYSYDGAGKKIREEFSSQIIDYQYNNLGWLATISKYNGDNTLLIHYARDLEGRIIQEHKTDTAGNTLYKASFTYDEDGNQNTSTSSINGKEAIDIFRYDSCCRQIEHHDAESHITKIAYNEGFINSLGQRVLQKITVDPRHIRRVETQDALTRSVRDEVLNASGSTISCQEKIYDPQGNLIFQKDHIYEKDHLRTTQIVKYSYTPNNQIASLTRAFGTKDARTLTYTYLPSGKMATKTLPDGVTLTYSYHPLGFRSRVDTSDDKIHHSFEYNRLGYLTSAIDENQRITIQRNVDIFGNVAKELFSTGFAIEKAFDAFNRLISLKMDSQGEVLYIYDSLFLRKVSRIANNGEVLYSHRYEEYDLNGNLMFESLIGNLGRIIHATDLKGQKTFISSPYFSQESEYDCVGNLISHRINKAGHYYSYDNLSQLTSEKSPTQTSVYKYDSLYNRIEKNGQNYQINDLNEFSFENGCSYDLNGNQILKQIPSETVHFTYDPLSRLTEAISEKKKISFTYDPLGRCLTKIVYKRTDHNWSEILQEKYLYHGQNEIGAFNLNNEPKNLRILGASKVKESLSTIGIELEGQVFAPLLDVQENIRGLVSFDTETLAQIHNFTAFGEELPTPLSMSLINPWRFASKRWDPDLGLIYYGKRFYDPQLGRWLTTDPAGFLDSSNPYQYVFNNPYRYADPDGEFAFVIPIVIWGAQSWVLPALYGAITGAVAYGAYKGVEALNSREHESYSPSEDYKDYIEKRHTPDQEALSEFVKEYGKKGVSNTDADTLLDWAKEYDFPARDDRGKDHWNAKDGAEHIHLGPKHIPITNG